MTPTAPPRPGPALVLGAYALGPALGAVLVLAVLIAVTTPGGRQASLADLDGLLAVLRVATLGAYVIAGPAALAAGIGHLMARSQGRWRLALPVAAAGLLQVLAVLLALALITGGELSLAWRRFEEYVLLGWLPPLAMGMAALIGAALLALERRARTVDARAVDANAVDTGEAPHG